MTWISRKIGKVWQVNLDGYWGEGFTQKEAMHHARFRIRLHKIIRSSHLLQHDSHWDMFPSLHRE